MTTVYITVFSHFDSISVGDHNSVEGKKNNKMTVDVLGTLTCVYIIIFLELTWTLEEHRKMRVTHSRSHQCPKLVNCLQILEV